MVTRDYRGLHGAIARPNVTLIEVLTGESIRLLVRRLGWACGPATLAKSNRHSVDSELATSQTAFSSEVRKFRSNTDKIMCYGRLCVAWTKCDYRVSYEFPARP